MIAVDESSDGAAVLQRISPAVAELIGYSELADSLRLALVDLQRRGWFDDQPPTFATIADVIGETEDRLHEIANSTKQPVLDLARILLPIVGALNASAADELLKDIETFADEQAAAAWLEKSGHDFPMPPSAVVEACRGEDLNAARVALGIPLRSLNDVLRKMGKPYEPLLNEDGIAHSFRYFVSSHREQILASLRTRFLDAYRQSESLEEYVSRREFAQLTVDPMWLEEYCEIDEGLIRTRVNTWLAEANATPLEGSATELIAVDEVRRFNRAALASLLEKATDVVSAWELKHVGELSGLPGAPGPIVDHAADAGRFDFERIIERDAVAWLQSSGYWHASMPATLTIAELELSENDVKAAVRVREAQAQLQRDKARQIVIDGTITSADLTNYAAIATSIKAGLSAALLATPASLTQLAHQSGSGPPAPPRPNRGGTTAARRPRLSDAQAGAVGLAGEVVALEWLSFEMPNRLTPVATFDVTSGAESQRVILILESVVM